MIIRDGIRYKPKDAVRLGLTKARPAPEPAPEPEPTPQADPADGQDTGDGEPKAEDQAENKAQDTGDGDKAERPKSPARRSRKASTK